MTGVMIDVVARARQRLLDAQNAAGFLTTGGWNRVTPAASRARAPSGLPCDELYLRHQSHRPYWMRTTRTSLRSRRPHRNDASIQRVARGPRCVERRFSAQRARNARARHSRVGDRGSAVGIVSEVHAESLARQTCRRIREIRTGRDRTLLSIVEVAVVVEADRETDPT
jgi:hypothetical protein